MEASKTYFVCLFTSFNWDYHVGGFLAEAALFQTWSQADVDHSSLDSSFNIYALSGPTYFSRALLPACCYAHTEKQFLSSQSGRSLNLSLTDHRWVLLLDKEQVGRRGRTMAIILHLCLKLAGDQEPTHSKTIHPNCVLPYSLQLQQALLRQASFTE